MTTRITAGAFLVCGNKVLLMKRGLHKKLAPGLWASVGGHLDLCDIKDPRALDFAETCLREVYEETGIEKSEIHRLKLRYITALKKIEEISLIYHYFGEVADELPLQKCDEGEFHWIEKKDILDLPMSAVVKEVLRHWLTTPDSDNIFFVIVNLLENSIFISKM